MTENYTIEQFKEEFENTSTFEGKSDVIIKATCYCIEFAPDVDSEFLEIVKEYKHNLLDNREDFIKEENDICNRDIENGHYELYICIKSFEIYPGMFVHEGNRYYIKVDDFKSELGVMWSEVATDEMKKIIDNMKPVIWVITDGGIGTFKSRNLFREDFESYFIK